MTKHNPRNRYRQLAQTPEEVKAVRRVLGNPAESLDHLLHDEESSSEEDLASFLAESKRVPVDDPNGSQTINSHELLTVLPDESQFDVTLNLKTMSRADVAHLLRVMKPGGRCHLQSGLRPNDFRAA